MRQTTERTGVGWSRQRFGPDKPGCWNRKTLVGELYKNNRSKSACTLNARKRLNNQAVWPVIFDITGPICARALKTKIPLTLGPRGHHDWPVMSENRKVRICANVVQPPFSHRMLPLICQFVMMLSVEDGSAARRKSHFRPLQRAFDLD